MYFAASLLLLLLLCVYTFRRHCRAPSAAAAVVVAFNVFADIVFMVFRIYNVYFDSMRLLSLTNTRTLAHTHTHRATQ